jgi:uncharacterized protein with HEPN domain
MKKENAANLLRLWHIKKAAEKVVAAVDRIGLEGYENDELYRLAFEKLIQNLGESAYNLTDDLKMQHPHIEWKKIEGTRHRVVHDYYVVDETVIWKIATLYVPQLLTDIEPIIEALTPDGD